MTKSSKTVVYDIESMVDTKLYEWQKDMLNTAVGFKSGEMAIMTAGRNTGKSVLNSATFQSMWNSVFNPKPVPISDLILDEGKVYGARYYTIEPVGGTWLEMEDWSREAFGDPAEIWYTESSSKEEFMWPENGRWYMNNRKFWFRSIKDRDWFIMRWRS
jgi:hypothetical protein